MPEATNPPTESTTGRSTPRAQKEAPTDQPWPLPSTEPKGPGLAPAFQISAFSSNGSLGIASLGVGAGALGRRYRTSIE